MKLAIAGGPLRGRRFVLAALETLAYDRTIKKRQYFVSKHGSSIYI